MKKKLTFPGVDDDVDTLSGEESNGETIISNPDSHVCIFCMFVATSDASAFMWHVLI